MSTAKDAARAAQQSTAFRVIARIGYVVLGVVHIVIGFITVSITAGSGENADQSGAMERLREAPVGAAVLWAVALGLAALAVWQLAEAVLERDPDTKKKWGYRVKYIGTAAAYLAIASTALVTTLGGRSDSAQSSQTLSAQLLATPGGVFLLVLIGAVVAGIGAAFVIRGFTTAFEKSLDLPTGAARKGIIAFGVVGYVAKGIAVTTAGVLFVVAAMTHDPETAGGLDSALHSLAALPLGTFVLWIVGAGLVVYGVFCLARARYARM